MRFVIAVCLSAAAFVGVAGVANARTPTPTPTPEPTSTATPAPPQPAVFGGTAWVDGRISSGPVVAKIGDTVCGTATILGIPDAGFSYQVEVVSEEASPECGVEGATVTFFVAGKQAAQTAVWHSGSFQHLTLIDGPYFSMFGGVFTIDRELTSDKLIASVGGTACGDYNEWIGVGPVYSYFITVFSNQLPGCGTEGAEVTFKLVDAQGSVIAVAKEKGVWHVWGGDGEPSQLLNLTFEPGSGNGMPGTGTGGAPPDEAGVWRRLSVLLAFAGLTSAAIGFALRKRPMTR